MKNWRLWAGFVLSIAAFISYFAFFARFPITRDVPWVNFILFVVATVLLIAGFRRSQRKIWSGIVAFLGIAVFAFFVFAVTVATRRLPPSHGAPHVGDLQGRGLCPFIVHLMNVAVPAAVLKVE